VSDERTRPGTLRFVVPGVILLVSVAYAVMIHHGLGPRPELPESALRWWSPRGFLMQALVGSSWESLLNDRAKGMAVFGTPSLLLLIALWATTRSALARALAVTTMLAITFFLYYALGSGNAQLVWNFFHWRWSGTMLAVATVMGCAIASPWLAASWLRLGWIARLAWFLPITAAVLVIERNVTGTDEYLPFAISPWPAVQVFGFEAIGTTLAAELAGAAILCVVLLAIAAIGVRFDPERLRRRAVHTAAAGVLLGLPLFVGEAWARWDYTRTRDVYAQRIIDALDGYYAVQTTYPESLEQLVEAKLLDAIPKPEIGFALPGEGENVFTYQGFGTSYLLEFSAPRWVQCAYNPPYLDEDGEQADPDHAPDVAQGGEGSTPEGKDDLGDGAWSCPSKPPELW